ncbi:MAG: MBL fold metallo-hydrolase [bacterium]|nr:MBL fold metallo-hydrolase [bacterium]
MNQKLKLTFCGGAQSVTGSNYLLESGDTKILVDCGLFQGTKISEDKNDDSFPYDPASIDALFITHAHLDHIGRVPKLVRDGFRGKIFSTPPTRDLAELMLADSLGVMRKEARRSRKKDAIYSEDDIQRALGLWNPVDYHDGIPVADFNINFRDAGHVMGSAMVEIARGGKKILFTGDLGNPPNPLLRDTEKVTDADFLIIESTYGDREHEELNEANLKLERVIEDTMHSGGALMIPAFSLERTQKLLFQINDLVEHGRIPRAPIFLDSPLAIKATNVYKKYQRYYNENAKDIIRSGDALFQFPGLKMTLKTEESKAIKRAPFPKIIIAGSGMSNGGRIVHHELNYLPDPKSALLLMGYQAAGSLGRRLQERQKTVRIMGETVRVRARVENIRGYSAHPDMNDLFDFVHNTADTVKKVFVVQGEPKSSLFFTQRLRDYLGVDAAAPETGDNFELDI